MKRKRVPPSRKYRDYLRSGIRWFSSREDEKTLFPDGISYATKPDLEAGFELIMGAKPIPPKGYKPRSTNP